MTASLEAVITAIDGWLGEPGWPLIVGICGSQGSGKSTLAAGLANHYTPQGIATEVLSLDDLYFPPESRPVDIHPLFATRGVPGTHDVQLGIDVLDSFSAGEPVAVPRFDKANDKPFPRSDWPFHEFPKDLILLEGWCVGAVAQPTADLAEPVNDLERNEDPNGVWRRHVNDALASTYADLFARIDRLVLLAAPDFEVVQAWRTEQEHALSRMLEREGRPGAKVMTDDQIKHFIQHYERLTRYILTEMPQRADLTLRLDANRGLI